MKLKARKSQKLIILLAKHETGRNKKSNLMDFLMVLKLKQKIKSK